MRRAAAGLALLTVAFSPVAYQNADLNLPNRPPLAHTGGFGEPTCAECHFGNSMNEPGGALSLAGLPEEYQPGLTYRISVRLARAELGRGGFELAARVADGPAAGRQAGLLESSDERVNVADSSRADRGVVQYARHTQVGSERGELDTLQWAINWTAPAAGTGAVIFHVAANAANDDNSPLGDFIYTTTARVQRVSREP